MLTTKRCIEQLRLYAERKQNLAQKSIIIGIVSFLENHHQDFRPEPDLPADIQAEWDRSFEDVTRR